MCNAWNHTADCPCGFGGTWYGNVPVGGGRRTKSGFHVHECTFSGDFCRPTKCPLCGAEVFFVRHNGGSVWFDGLGWPWPKHGCFAEEGFRPKILDWLRSSRPGKLGPLARSLLKSFQLYHVERTSTWASGSTRYKFCSLIDRHRQRTLLRINWNSSLKVGDAVFAEEAMEVLVDIDNNKHPVLNKDAVKPEDLGFVEDREIVVKSPKPLLGWQD